MSFLSALRSAIQSGAIPLEPQETQPVLFEQARPGGWEAPARRGPAVARMDGGKDRVTQGERISFEELVGEVVATPVSPLPIRDQLEASLAAAELETLALGIMDPLPALEPPPRDPFLQRRVEHRLRKAEGMEQGQPPAQVSGHASGQSALLPPLALSFPAVDASFDLPLDLAELPLYADVSGPAGTGKTFW
ncbi:MAG TPA: hypothetical protein VIM84_09330, partial [Gemmatimonadales bacterium]